MVMGFDGKYGGFGVRMVDRAVERRDLIGGWLTRQTFKLHPHIPKSG